MLDDEDQKIEYVHWWMMRWARSMRRDRAEILADLGYPAMAAGGQLALTNYAVAEEDSAHYYDIHDSRQVEVVDKVMTDMRSDIPWVYWAVCRKHKLGSMGLEEYEKRAAAGAVPPGIYRSALEELAPVLEAHGLV